MRQTTLRLTEGDYLFLQQFCGKGVHSAREINRAHLLVALHQNVPEAAILQVLGIGRSSLWRTRAAYNERGLAYALHDEARPGQPRKYQTDQEAEVVALACSNPPAGRKRWTLTLLTDAVRRRPKLQSINRETVRQILKKNECKPWRKLMWCVGRITTEYRERMYDLLGLYARPYREAEPVVCLDEKSKQLLGQARKPLGPRPGGQYAKEDYEYRRHGTRNIFIAVEPKGGQRLARLTGRRTKSDFVAFVQHLVGTVYATARRVHLVLDNLNTHFRQTFVDVLGSEQASALLERVAFHYTPKHDFLKMYSKATKKAGQPPAAYHFLPGQALGHDNKIQVKFYVALPEKACEQVQLLCSLKERLPHVGIIRVKGQGAKKECRDYIKHDGEHDFDLAAAKTVSVSVVQREVAKETAKAESAATSR